MDFTPNSRVKVVVLAVALACLASPLLAQESEGSRWLTLPVDPNQVTLESRVNTLAVQEDDRILLHSGILRSWTSLPVTSGAFVTAQNEHAIVEDGNLLHAWSAWVGEVDTLALSASGFMLPGPGSANYIAAAQDGMSVFATSGYEGVWVEQQLATSSPQTAIGRQCMLVLDGTTPYAFSAFHGTWVEGPQTSSGATLTADGQVGVIDAGTSLLGFCATTNTWSERAVSGAGILETESGFAYYEEGNSVEFFSGFRGAWSNYVSPGASVVVDSARDLAVVTSDSEAAIYNAVAATVQSLPLAWPTVWLGQSYAILDDGQDLIPFSTTWDAFGPTKSGAHSGVDSYSRGHIAFVYDSTGLSGTAYSSLTNSWNALPGGDLDVLELASATILVRDAVGEHHAFHARSGDWVTLASGAGSVLHAPSRQASTFLVEEGPRVDVWDARLGRWVGLVEPNGGAWSTIDISFSTAMVENGDSAFAYGIDSPTWDSVRIQGSVLESSSGSRTGYVQTDTHLHVHSPHGTLATPFAFPESGQRALLGEAFWAQQVATPGSQAVVLFGWNFLEQPTEYGTLFIQSPARLTRTIVPASGRLVLDYDLPSSLAFTGSAFLAQCAVVGPAGSGAYLSNVIAPILQ